jgi:hypothetical protein
MQTLTVSLSLSSTCESDTLAGRVTGPPARRPGVDAASAAPRKGVLALMRKLGEGEGAAEAVLAWRGRSGVRRGVVRPGVACSPYSQSRHSRMKRMRQ